MARSQDPHIGSIHAVHKVLILALMPKESDRKLFAIAVVVLRHQHSHQWVLSEPHVWRTQRHETEAFREQTVNKFVN